MKDSIALSQEIDFMLSTVKRGNTYDVERAFFEIPNRHIKRADYIHSEYSGEPCGEKILEYFGLSLMDIEEVEILVGESVNAISGRSLLGMLGYEKGDVERMLELYLEERRTKEQSDRINDPDVTFFTWTDGSLSSRLQPILFH